MGLKTAMAVQAFYRLRLDFSLARVSVRPWLHGGLRGIFAAALLAVGEHLSAAEAPPSTTAVPKNLSLADAKRIALERNWDLLAARSDVDIATAQKIVAKEFPNPNLSLSTAQINVDGHPNHTSSGNGLWERSYDTLATVNQLFEIGGKRRARQASAQSGVVAAQARFADARRILDLAVTKAYLGVLQAEATVQVLRESATSLRKEAQIAQTRLQAGDIAKTDQNQIEIAAGRFELDARSAETTATNLRIALETLLGVVQPRGDWVAVDTLESLSKDLGVENTTAATGPGARPDLLAAEAALKKAEADVRLQKANRIPDPTVALTYEHEPTEFPNALGLGVSFPLPLWNRNRGAISAAQAAREQAQTQLEKIRGQINSEIISAQISYRSAQERYESYRRDLQPRSSEIRKAISFAYEKGGASLLDLLSAERSDNDVRLATAQAAADAAAAAASLRAAVFVSPSSTATERK